MKHFFKHRKNPFTKEEDHARFVSCAMFLVLLRGVLKKDENKLQV